MHLQLTPYLNLLCLSSIGMAQKSAQELWSQRRQLPQRETFAGAGLSWADGVGLVVFDVRKIKRVSFIHSDGEGEVFHQLQGCAIFFRSQTFF